MCARRKSIFFEFAYLTPKVRLEITTMSSRTAASSPLQGRREGGIEIVTLNRPAQRNAMSAALVDELIAVISAIENDPDVGALVLVGAAAGFCAGSDLGGLAAMGAAARRGFEAASGRVARMIAQRPKPVLAAAHGFPMGRPDPGRSLRHRPDGGGCQMEPARSPRRPVPGLGARRGC